MQGYVVGKVDRVEWKTPEGQKKPFCQMSLVERDGEFNRYVKVRVYGKSGEEAMHVPRGTMVLASGEVTAYVSPPTRDGKTYANLTILGRIQPIMEAELKPENGAKEKAPERRPGEAPGRAVPIPASNTASEQTGQVGFDDDNPPF